MMAFLSESKLELIVGLDATQNSKQKQHKILILSTCQQWVTVLILFLAAADDFSPYFLNFSKFQIITSIIS